MLLAAMVGVTKWHHNIDRESFAYQLDSDVYLMNLLGEKLTEKDEYIAALENIILALHIEVVESADDLVPLPEPIIDIEN